MSDIKDNQIELLKEDLECVHKWLDDMRAPREDDNGTFSIVGRMKWLLERSIKQTWTDAAGCAHKATTAATAEGLCLRRAENFSLQWERPLPLSREELLELRKETLLRYGGMHQTITTPDKFTCDDCEAAIVCTLVFDLYNTNGDCLAEK